MVKSKIRNKIIKGSIVAIVLGAINYGLSTLGMTPLYYTLLIMAVFFIYGKFL